MNEKQYPTPTLHHLPLRERPARRVAENGADACSLVEILATIVGGARQIEIAHGLLAEFGGGAYKSWGSSRKLCY